MFKTHRHCCLLSAHQDLAESLWTLSSCSLVLSEVDALESWLLLRKSELSTLCLLLSASLSSPVHSTLEPLAPSVFLLVLLDGPAGKHSLSPCHATAGGLFRTFERVEQCFLVAVYGPHSYAQICISPKEPPVPSWPASLGLPFLLVQSIDCWAE